MFCMHSLKFFNAILKIPGVNYLKVVVRLHLDQVPWIEPIEAKSIS